MKEKCPYCEKYYNNILTHISLQHDITSLEVVAERIKFNEEEDNKKQAFSDFTKKLTDLLSRKEITGQQYRDEVQKWYREKKWLNTNE